MKNNKNKKKVIVTGCAGFIGSNLVDKLLLKNYQVIGIDNLNTGQKKFLNNSLKNKNFKFMLQKFSFSFLTLHACSKQDPKIQI